MDGLRLALIIAGIAVVAAVYFWSARRRRFDREAGDFDRFDAWTDDSADPLADDPTCGGSHYTWTTGFLVFAVGDTNNVYDSDVDELLRIGRPTVGGISIRTNSTTNRNLEYNSDGTTNETDTARFAVCDKRGGIHGRQINVPRHGRPKFIKGEKANPINCNAPA